MPASELIAEAMAAIARGLRALIANPDVRDGYNKLLKLILDFIFDGAKAFLYNTLKAD
jgi:hypothetical protein